MSLAIPPTPSSRPPRSLLLCGLVLCLCGCATSAKRLSADKIPAHLQVAAATNAQTLDLTKLASSTPNNDRINHGDVLDITISSGLSSGETITFPVRVGDDGNANMPTVGSVSLAGLELSDAESAIAATAIQKGLYKAPHITATMKRRKMHRVTVTGAVEKPNVYELPADGSDLLAAISAAGGLSKNASTSIDIFDPKGQFRAVPKRDPIAGGQPNDDGSGKSGLSPAGHAEHETIGYTEGGGRYVQVDLVSAVKDGAGTNGRYKIPDGGVVNVKKQDVPPIQVQGLVTKPGSYELPVGKDVRLLDAIAMGGWISSPVADKVYVIRRDPGKPDPVVIQLSITKAKESGTENLLIGPGDVILVEQTPPTILLYMFRMINFGATLPLTTFF